MRIAIDANVLVRLIVLGALRETEWVLRNRYQLDKASVANAFNALLESSDIEFEHPPTVEEALYVWAHHPAADFADCLLTARAAHLGRSRFVTFDASAARLPGVELLTCSRPPRHPLCTDTLPRITPAGGVARARWHGDRRAWPSSACRSWPR